jgi:cell wall-associated NlpC family hydrolase
MQKRSLLLFATLVFLLPSGLTHAQSPFGESSKITLPTPSRPALQVPKSKPLPIVDPLASANSDALSAYQAYEALLSQAQAALAAKDFQKADEILSTLTQHAGSPSDENGPNQGLDTRMKSGGVSPWHVREMFDKASTLLNQMYSRMTEALLEQAGTFQGASTKKGPGRGNVACAWLMSKVLASAGLVPPGWMEVGALRLTQRLGKEFGWQKIPANALPNRGSMSPTDMKPGDLIFWSPSHHVGLYLGEGMAMSNSSSSAKASIHPAAGYYDGWTPRFVVRPPGSN